MTTLRARSYIQRSNVLVLGHVLGTEKGVTLVAGTPVFMAETPDPDPHAPKVAGHIGCDLGGKGGYKAAYL